MRKVIELTFNFIMYFIGFIIHCYKALFMLMYNAIIIITIAILLLFLVISLFYGISIVSNAIYIKLI